MELVIGIDIRTSGIRAQAVNAEEKKVISTAIALHNPSSWNKFCGSSSFCYECRCQGSSKYNAQCH